jgi:hypothetical protein
LLSPAAFRYSVTTVEPGYKLVFIYAFGFIPLYAAFLASNPAAIIASGFEVFVQEVIAAKTIEPFFNA